MKYLSLFNCNIFLKMYSNIDIHMCLTCVNTIVSFEIVITDKGFLTLIAFVRLFPSVPESMT